MVSHQAVKIQAVWRRFAGRRDLVNMRTEMADLWDENGKEVRFFFFLFFRRRGKSLGLTLIFFRTGHPRGLVAPLQRDILGVGRRQNAAF